MNHNLIYLETFDFCKITYSKLSFTLFIFKFDIPHEKIVRESSLVYVMEENKIIKGKLRRGKELIEISFYFLLYLISPNFFVLFTL